MGQPPLYADLNRTSRRAELLVPLLANIQIEWKVLVPHHTFAATVHIDDKDLIDAIKRASQYLEASLTPYNNALNSIKEVA